MRFITTLFLFAALSSLNADQMIQWGEPNGDVSIVESTIKLERPFNTSYQANTQTAPTSGTSYYPNSQGRNTQFNVTSSAANANVIIANRSDGDAIAIGKNDYKGENMVVWENAPSGQLNTLSINIEASGSGFTSGSYRFILEDSAGKWAASEAYPITKTGVLTPNLNAKEMSWHAFTPMDSRSANIGNLTSINSDAIKSVGCYCSMDENDLDSYKGAQIRYFNASFKKKAETNVKMNRPTKMTTEGNGRIVADFSNDFNAQKIDQGWRYLWNPTGVEIGDHANYKPLEHPVGKARLVVDTEKLPGKDGPENATWLTIRKGIIAPGLSLKESTDELTHFAIVAYTIQEGEAGKVSIQNSIIKGRTDASRCEMRIYINDSLLGSDITGGAASKFDIELGQMDIGDTFYLALGGHEDKSVGTTVQFQLVSE